MSYMVSGLRQARVAMGTGMDKEAGKLTEFLSAGKNLLQGKSLLHGVPEAAAAAGGVGALGGVAARAKSVGSAAMDDTAYAALRALAKKDAAAQRAAARSGKGSFGTRPQSVEDLAAATHARRMRGLKSNPGKLDQAMTRPAPINVKNIAAAFKPVLSSGAQWGTLAAGAGGLGQLGKNAWDIYKRGKTIKNMAVPAAAVGGGMLLGSALSK